MTNATITVDGIQFEVVQSEDGYINLTQFFKSNPQLRPASLKGGQIKGWINAQKVAETAFKNGDKGRTWMVRHDLMITWVRQGLQSAVINEERTTNFDTREDSNISKMFQEVMGAVKSTAADTKAWFDKQFQGLETRIMGLSSWVSQVHEEVKQKADKEEVEVLKDRLRKQADELRRLEEMIKAQGR